MEWIDYFKHDYFTAQELGRINNRIKRTERRDRRQKRTHADLAGKIEDLQEDVGRLSLLVCSLMELGLAKGAFSKEELLAQMTALDSTDGEADGQLDPKWMKPEEEPKKPVRPKIVRKKRR